VPTYAFRNLKTEEIFEVFMRMSERETYLAAHPELEQTFVEAPACGNRFIEIGKLTKDTPSDYKNMLKRIQKNNPGSKINTLGA
jgi:hypothetical protein